MTWCTHRCTARGQRIARTTRGASKQPPVADGRAFNNSKLDAIAGPEHGGGGFGRGSAGHNPGIGPRTPGAHRASIESADEAPTAAQFEAYQIALKRRFPAWSTSGGKLKETDLKSLNEQLKRQHFALLNLDTSKFDHDMEDELEMGDEE